MCVRKSLMQKFELDGMEYFNTFGGNPVSCAAGLAVLDEIEGQKLGKNADYVGKFIVKKMRQLMDDFPSDVGDVRGRGLLIGVELSEGGGAAGTSAAAPALSPALTSRRPRGGRPPGEPCAASWGAVRRGGPPGEPCPKVGLGGIRAHFGCYGNPRN